MASKNRLKATIESYDLVCIGGGVSGLYAAYKWCIENPHRRRVLVIEKSGRLGGRIQTIKMDGLQFEAGAGRFHSSHTKLWNLLRELQLEERAQPLPKDEHYFIDGIYLKSQYDVMQHYNLTRSIEDIWRYIYLTMDDNKAKTMTLLEYINNIDLRDNEVDALITTFGYKSEFVLFNAFHAIHIIGHDFNIAAETGDQGQFYTLKGGLSMIVNKLRDRIIGYGATIRLRTECWGVDVSKDGCIVYMSQYPTELICRTEYCIAACPSTALQEIRFRAYEDIQRKPSKVNIPEKYIAKPFPLYRMYSRYPKNADGRVWFDGLPKVITDLPISMIIPINYDTGLIMISYTDDGDSVYWNRYGSKEEIQEELRQQLAKVFPDKVIPEPLWTSYHYWQEGCHAWTKENNGRGEWRRVVERFQKELFDRVAWMNEASSFHQAWIEGSLELVDEWVIEHRIKVSGGSKISLYTKADVAKHNKMSDAWTIISGEVYDITKWIPKHPGGALTIMQIAGKDGTRLFMGNPIHMQKGAIKILKQYWIGRLK